MNNLSILGWIATSLSLIYRLPQIYKTYKVKRTEGLSYFSYIIQTISYIFYILYGYFSNDFPIFGMGIIAIIQNFIILFLYFYYNKKSSENIPT
jgi:uncharacterized protein with PQ loop repeat